MIDLIIVFGFISFFLGLLVIPKLISRLIEKDFFGFDVHKLRKTKVAEPGGFGVVFPFITTILLYIAFITYSDSELKVNLIAATLSIIIAGLIGIIDDMLALSWRVKIFSAFIPALPLMVLKAGESSMIFPIIGSVELGVFYSLLMVPLMVNFALNSFNMLAGFNGLESGMAIISLLTVIIAGVKVGNVDVAIIAVATLGATLAFYLFNKYPSKVFPGDTGTFFWGAVLISALIIGNMEKLAIGIFFLYFVNFFMLFFHIAKRCRNKFSKIDIKGELRPECWHSIYWIIPYKFKGLKENQVVKIVLALQAVICFISLIIFI